MLVLVAAAFALAFARLLRLGPSLELLLPQRQYELTIGMQLDGHGEPVKVRVALPLETPRQSVRQELVSSGDFKFVMAQDGANRWGVWELAEARGGYGLVYTSTVLAKGQKYELAPAIALPSTFASEVQRSLLPSELVQSGAPEIVALLEKLVPPEERRNVTAIVRRVFDYAHRVIAPADVSGSMDALTCLRLGEASCGGKARLFTALCRAAGVPARLVGGLILKSGNWTAAHVWSEVWIGERWIPCCPLNGWFAEARENYLVAYYGDEAFFTHTRDINFRHTFHARTILAPSPAATAILAAPAGAFNLWSAFEQVRIPVELLKIILMLPFGALVVVVARNIGGIQTFGTFMPALVAVGFRETGLAWGVVLFGSIILFGAAVRFGLDRFQLLHTPRLAALLTATVIFILGIAVSGVAFGFVLPTRVTLFPLVIFTLTVERFANYCDEERLAKALGVTAATIVVVCAAYFVMEWELLQVITVAFPEVLLLVAAAFFVIGRWTGMRLAEYVRFRRFLGVRP